MRQQGFSLLEMVVAMAIMAMALGAIYQSAGGSVRMVHAGGQYAHAVTLAESLLAEHSRVPEQGLEREGSDGDFDWRVSARPIEPLEDPPRARLQDITVTVSWGNRNYELHSVVAGTAP